MTEECMKLITTEAKGPNSLKLQFSTDISKLTTGTGHESPDFNIHDVVEICFFLECINTNIIRYKICTRNITSAKDLIVEIQVVCDKPNVNKNLLCTEKWCEWNHLGDRKDNGYFNIEVVIMVSKVDSLIKKLYEDEEFIDFKLSTEEGSVAVHRAHLAANSDVFKAMLSREWKETTEGSVQIEGVTLQTLKDLKQYMYLGILPNNGLGPLLLIARYYLIDNLIVECRMKLAQSVTPENLYDILEFSILNKMPELTFDILETMSKSNVQDARKNIVLKHKASNASEQTDEKTEQEQNDKNEE